MQLGAHQMAVLDDRCLQKFDARVAAYLRQHHGACRIRTPVASFTVAEMSGGALTRLVAIALQRGRGHGLVWQSSLNAFATLMVKVAPNFDRYPKVAHALAAGLRPADFGMRELPALMTPADWRAAARAYEPSAWSDEAPPR